MTKYQVTDPEVKDLLDRWDYFQDRWRDIREDAKEDMRYVSGDPWDPKEKRARQALNRPCLVVDELGQYVNQLINDVRQNKRAVKVNPTGAGANDKTANFRENMIRGIEYQSNGQTAYITAAENAFQRSYGYWRINTGFVSEKSFDQEILIKSIPNPDTVFMDPDAKNPTCDDGKDAFVVDLIPKTEFKKRWPKAKITDFSMDMQEASPSWIKESEIQIAEYWKVIEKDRKLLMVQTPHGPIPMWADELPKYTRKTRVLAERVSKSITVVQQMTNGIEILEENKWAGRYIPIIPVFGKEMWVDEGSGSKRKLMSLIRLARDPYMLYCYVRTCQMELVAMTPKTPWIVAEGQIAGHESEWQSANTVPTAYLQYKTKTQEAGDAPLPPPTRQPYEPALQQLEIAAEAARRAIQAAIGINPLPTAAQRQNEKSGVAIERIQSEADQGSFHFIDNFDRAIHYNGVVINDLLKPIYDTARDVGVRLANEEHKTIRINDAGHANSEEGADTSIGDHSITISVGPSHESEREEASEFVDTLIANIQALSAFMSPQQIAKLMAMAIKLKDVGPLGDEMSDIVSPPETEANMQQQLQQAQSQLQQYQQLIASLQAETQKLYAEKNGKIVDNEYMLKAKQMDNKLKLDIAEIGATTQDAKARQELTTDLLRELHVSAHDVAMQAVQHAHEQFQAKQAADAQSSLAAQSQAADAAQSSAESGQGETQ
jgi:hypothetical protein